MQAIRKIEDVKDRTVIVHLPEEFPFTDRVEVIILPAQPSNGGLFPENQAGTTVSVTVDQFIAMDTSKLTENESGAYEQCKTLVRKGRRPTDPRLLGVFSGLVQMSEDFDAPMPDEGQFWGNDTDAYGISTKL